MSDTYADSYRLVLQSDTREANSRDMDALIQSTRITEEDCEKRSMAFHFSRLKIPELLLIDPQPHFDERGFLMECYRYSDFSTFGLKEQFFQENHSRSVNGVLRGLHYQKLPRAQGKLVRVAVGEIFDVAVDIRRGSPTYGKWIGVRLSATNRRMLYIPPGFAHGFCVVSKEAEILYKATQEYSLEHDRGVAWNDTEIGIRWPTERPIVSTRDAGLPSLREADNNFTYHLQEA